MLNSYKGKELVTRMVHESSKHAERNPILQYSYIRGAYLFDSKDSDSIEQMIVFLYNMRDYNGTLEYCEKWFDQLKYIEEEKKARILFIRAKSNYHLQNFSKVVQDANEAITNYTIKDKGAQVEEIKRFLSETFPQQEGLITKSDEEKRDEIIFVKKHLDEPQLPDSINQKVYILPGDWLTKWKKYIEYSKILGESDGMIVEEDSVITHPGPIMPFSILSDDNCLIDPEPTNIYTNLPLRTDLIENRDFFIIPEDLWNYLYQKYGGIPIERYTYRKSPSDINVSVEVWLQKANVWVLPLPLKSQPASLLNNDCLFISKRKTISDLKNKIFRSLLPLFAGFNNRDNRISKLDPRFSLPKAWREWEKGDFVVAAKIFEDEQILVDDAEVADTDFLLFEAKIVQDWFIKYEADIDRIQRKKNNSMINENPTSSLSIADAGKFPSGAKKGLTGLQNLGNTCFMNSALQCLSNTFELTMYFLSNEYEKDINASNPLGTGGKLALAYSNLMKEMWIEKHSSVSPWELKKTIGRLASQFLGYGQQDSQELLSYLLDGLHEDLNRVKKKPITESKDYDDKVKDEIIASESWENHLKRNKSKIQELMHGQFKSTLICPTCNKVSITCDPFMMLSVPIPSNEYVKFFAYFIYTETKKKTPAKIYFNMISSTNFDDIKEKMAQATKTNANDLIVGLLKDHKIIEYADRSSTPTYLKDHAGIVFVYEMPNSQIEVEESKSFNLKVMVIAEAKAFYDSEKAVSFTRLVKIDTSMTLKQVYVKIYSKFRHHFVNYFSKQKITSVIDMDDWTEETLNKEYDTLFSDENEAKWLYRLCFKDDHPQVKGKSKKCSDLNEKDTFAAFLEKNSLTERHCTFEIKITKPTKIEDLGLNQCTDLSTSEVEEEGSTKKNCTVYDCLDLFTKKETLEKGNEWYCGKCKEHKLASKKMEIYRAPQILIVHLKRFKTSKVGNIGSFYYSSGSKKITAQVDFPQENLDLSRYILGPDRDTAVYDLFAVSNHFGGLSGGHYTAYAKNQFDNKWYDFNDSSVSSASSKEIVSTSAYVLFYRKKPNGKL